MAKTQAFKNNLGGIFSKFSIKTPIFRENMEKLAQDNLDFAEKNLGNLTCP